MGMYEKLTVELDLGLRLIAAKKQVAIRKPVIENLVFAGFITNNFFCGWIVSSKGRQYLKEHPKE